MKKHKALIISCVAAAVLILSGIGVFAAGQVAKSTAISEETARNFAYADAGISPENATPGLMEFDFDHGHFVYEFEFFAEGTEYDYVVDAFSGEILERASEPMEGYVAASDSTGSQKTDEKPAAESTPSAATESTPEAPAAPAAPAPATPAPAADSSVSLEKAKSIALSDAGLSASSVVFSKAVQDYDDGRLIYELEFYVTGGSEYDYDIDASTGAILEKSQEPYEPWDD